MYYIRVFVVLWVKVSQGPLTFLIVPAAPRQPRSAAPALVSRMLDSLVS